MGSLRTTSPWTTSLALPQGEPPELVVASAKRTQQTGAVCSVHSVHSSAESGMQKPLSPSQHRLPKLSELEVSNFGVGSFVGFTCDHGISVINWGPTIRVVGAGSRAGAGSSDAASP